MTANHVLEIANNLATINRGFLVVYLLWFLLLDGARPARRAPSTLVVSDIRKHAMCLAFGLTVDKVGALIVGVTVWLWRKGIGGISGPIVVNSVPGMVAGSILMAVGTLLLLRILSMARFGAVIWGAAAAASMAFILAAVLMI